MLLSHLLASMGGDLGGTGGLSPKIFRWGTAMHPSPSIFGEVVLRGEREKYEVTKIGDLNEFSLRNRGFSLRKGHYMYMVYIRFQTGTKEKKNFDDSKKDHLKIFGVEMEIIS